ncbi:hypothetical protein TWF281_000094 [Arthrobotrys megalospora]
MSILTSWQPQTSSHNESVGVISGTYYEQWAKSEHGNDLVQLQGQPSEVPAPQAAAVETAETEVVESIDVKTYRMKPLKRHAFQDPTVTISIWDSAEKCWNPCQTDQIKLVLGKKKIKLERRVRVKETLEGGFKTNHLVTVCSLEWKPDKTLIPAFLERFEAPAKRTKKRVMERYKPIFYFEVPDGGLLQRVREDETPSAAAEETLDSLTSLYYIQENIVKQLSTFPQSVWIRLESNIRDTAQAGGPVERLLGPDNRYQLVGTFGLPLGGERPFLWGVQGPDGMERMEGGDRAVYSYSSSPIQKHGVTGAVTRVPRSSGSTGTGFTGGESVSRAPQSVIAESEAPNNTQMIVTALTEVKSTGMSSFYDIQIPERSVSLGTSRDEDQLEEEQSILARLVDIDRELELLREKRALIQRLGIIKARGSSGGTAPSDLLE